MTPLTTDIATTVIAGEQVTARVYRDPQGVVVGAYRVDTGQQVLSLVDPNHDLTLALRASLIDARLHSTRARAATDPRPADPSS